MLNSSQGAASQYASGAVQPANSAQYQIPGAVQGGLHPSMQPGYALPSQLQPRSSASGAGAMPSMVMGSRFGANGMQQGMPQMQQVPGRGVNGHPGMQMNGAVLAGSSALGAGGSRSGMAGATTHSSVVMPGTAAPPHNPSRPPSGMNIGAMGSMRMNAQGLPNAVAPTQQGQMGFVHSSPVGPQGMAEGGVELPSFDLSDFPSLGRGAVGHGMPGMPPGMGEGGLPVDVAGYGSAHPAKMRQSEFSMQSEDFPELPGLKPQSSSHGEGALEHDMMNAMGRGLAPSVHGEGMQGPGFGDGGPNSGHMGQYQPSSVHSSLLGGGPLSGGARGGPGMDLGQYQRGYSSQGQQPQQGPQQPSQQQQQGSQPSSQQQPKGHVQAGKGQQQGKQAGGLDRPSDRFGLLGLLGVIRMNDPDLTTLALGTDLTTLGLNLNSSETLYKSFASPWADGPARGEPEFTLPQCYIQQQPIPRLQPAHFSKLQVDTLIYIFYSMPNDEAQLYAADELSNRGWMFHKEHKVWLTRVSGLPEATVKTAHYELGSYWIFDTSTWQRVRKDNFVLHYDAVRIEMEVNPNAPLHGHLQGQG